MKDNNYIKNLILLLFIVITGGFSLLYIEQHNSNTIQKSKFAEELKVYFENNKIDSAIENDIYLGKKLLIENKGRWDDKELNYYIGFFETLSDYVDAGSLNYRDVFDEYSDDILLAYHNKEINNYIKNLRKSTKDNTYYEKFESLAKDFERSNKLIK